MELAPTNEPPPASVFSLPDFRLLLTSITCSTLAGQALVLVVRIQVYELTNSPLALGLLGLVEAIPAISLALYGGHVADRHDRCFILRTTAAVLTVCATLIAASVFLNGASQQWRGKSPSGATANTGAATTPQSAIRTSQLPASTPPSAFCIPHLATLAALFGIMFIVGIARSFAGPAYSALEAQVVPLQLIVKSATWFSAAWLCAAVLGPVLGGVALDTVGLTAAYQMIAGLYALAFLAAMRLSPHPVPEHPEDESIWQSISTGVKYVARDQVLLGSMSLDLFAVLFGGAIAILPIYARDILHVDKTHLGFLNAAPNAGALLTMLLATHRPPVRHAGRNLLVAVAGFGISMLVFAVSKNFYLSLACLFLSGVCDGVSVVIRRSIVRLMSPNYLRGRIAAVSLIFIGSSNEIGALESGLAAAWLGTVPSVLAGGMLTLLVVAVTSLLAPKLRTLSLDKPPQPI